MFVSEKAGAEVILSFCLNLIDTPDVEKLKGQPALRLCTTAEFISLHNI